eukprot:1421890-Alexandrium_andersonii.AAC.1
MTREDASRVPSPVPRPTACRIAVAVWGWLLRCCLELQPRTFRRAHWLHFSASKPDLCRLIGFAAA